MTITTTADVAAYAAAVREALADLPPEQNGVLDGLDEHLAEVAAEGDVTLVAALGTPEQYAAELRASAGLGGNVGTGAAKVAEPVSAWLSGAAPGAARRPPRLSPGSARFLARAVLAIPAVVATAAVVRAGSPNPFQLILVAGLIGGFAYFCHRILPAAALPESWGRPAFVVIAALSLLMAVLLGSRFSDGYSSNGYNGSSIAPVMGFDEPGGIVGRGAPLSAPAVVGTTFDQATRTLMQAGFTVSIRGAVDPGRAYVVVAQEPPAGVVASAGSAVALWVAPASALPPTTVSPTTTVPPTTTVSPTTAVSPAATNSTAVPSGGAPAPAPALPTTAVSVVPIAPTSVPAPAAPAPSTTTVAPR